MGARMWTHADRFTNQPTTTNENFDLPSGSSMVFCGEARSTFPPHATPLRCIASLTPAERSAGGSRGNDGLQKSGVQSAGLWAFMHTDERVHAYIVGPYRNGFGYYHKETNCQAHFGEADTETTYS